MKKIVVSLAILLLPFLTFCQTENNLVPVLIKADVMPQFIGGETALKEFLQTNIKYPETASKEGREGVVYVSFVVSNEGKVTDAKILRGVEKSLDEEALRVVNIMPAWKPGMQDGAAVNIQYNLPIRFNLNIPDENRTKQKH